MTLKYKVFLCWWQDSLSLTLNYLADNYIRFFFFVHPLPTSWRFFLWAQIGCLFWEAPLQLKSSMHSPHFWHQWYTSSVQIPQSRPERGISQPEKSRTHVSKNWASLWPNEFTYFLASTAQTPKWNIFKKIVCTPMLITVPFPVVKY